MTRIDFFPRVKLASLVLALAATGCGDGVGSDEDARRAYIGLDKSIDKALLLGMAGFNAATSANIPAQSTTGEVSGTLVVNGQVDQGASSNKGMRLTVALTNYVDSLPQDEEDDREVTYNTDAAALPLLNLSLRDIPNGTFTGTLVGKFLMTGDIEGDVTLNLSFAGGIAAVSGSTEDIQRVAGSTRITGSATSGEGTFQVDLTR